MVTPSWLAWPPPACPATPPRLTPISRAGGGGVLASRMFRQLLYVSRATPSGETVALDPIYESSRHNNAIDGVTGLLFSDGRRFVQVLEGPDEAVAATMARIAADQRHSAIEIVADQAVAAREFGQWSMADRRRGERADEFDDRLRALLRRASPATRDAFLDLLYDTTG